MPTLCWPYAGPMLTLCWPYAGHDLISGQYYFVNFPELSLTEWHPFSVTSAPTEEFVELHIRALGDHTRKIVALSKKCAEVW